ncbi:hypothetical protein MP228_002284 [Amoeboaphelidium protococcarum]|nr:hypothetical protein MP228_002284 [Amoeboaphelidium protococcarum]
MNAQKGSQHLGFRLHRTHPHLIKSAELITTGISQREYKLRQRALFSRFGVGQSQSENAIALLFGYRTRYTSGKIFYEFHQDSNVKYLSGVDEPNVILMLSQSSARKNPDGPEMTVFLDDNSRESIRWDGPSLGTRNAMNHFGADTAYSNSEFKSVLIDTIQKMIKSSDSSVNLYSNMSLMAGISQNVSNDASQHHYSPVATSELYNELAKIKGLHIHDSLRSQLSRMRLVKSYAEIELMQKSADIASEAFIQTMRRLPKLNYEYEVQAIFEYYARSNGAKLAYVPVIANNVNASVLHCVKNDMQLVDGLILIDAGCQYAGYCSDISRAIPRGGKFTQEEAAVYSALEKIQSQLLQAATSTGGMTLIDLHFMSVDLIRRKIVNEILQVKSAGDANRLANEIYPHGVGHHLGLDLHDVGDASNGDFISQADYDSVLRGHKSLESTPAHHWSRNKLVDGMCITVEPGVYLPHPDSAIVDDQPEWYQLIPEKYRGINIRVEDDIVIQGNQSIVLTSKVPKTLTDIERVMNS